MSLLNMQWVDSVQVGNPHAKALLRFLSTHNFSSEGFFFKTSTYAYQLEISEATVKRSFELLRKKELIIQEKRYDKAGKQIANFVRLNISKEFIQQYEDRLKERQQESELTERRVSPTPAHSEPHPEAQSEPPYNNNININNNIKTNKLKSSCASNDARSKNKQIHFDKFWQSYPRKVNKLRSKKIWDKKKLDEKADLIVEDVEQRINNDSAWRDEQFIPHPATYLLNERWEDEITLEKEKPKKQTTSDLFTRNAMQVLSKGNFL